MKASPDFRLQMDQWAGQEGSVWLEKGTGVAGREGQEGV